MNSGSVDLIYLDPPFNSNANYAAPIGSKAAGAAFRDTWTLSDVDVEWINLIEAKHPALYRVLLAAGTDSDKSYLAYMAARLLEMRRILKPTGSIYLHCDPTMSHYLKLVMDAIFGRKNFRNEIIWCYTGPGSPGMRQFNRKHDNLFWYNFGKKWTFNGDSVRMPHKDGKPHSGGFKGNGKSIDSPEYSEKGKIPETWWPDFSPVGRLKKERLGYPTQTPLALLDRILRASSNEGDVVLDPFCGCATTLVAADRLQRQWAGIDLSAKAAELVVRRLGEEAPHGKRGRAAALNSLLRNITHRTDIPHRTDIMALKRYNHPDNRKFLYGEQGGHCAGCGEHFEARHLEVDHIIARQKGGTDHIGNLQLLCGSCNRIKGARGMEYLRSKLQIAA